MIASGVALVRNLDAANWDVSAAFWFYDPESTGWRLRIASSAVDAVGPRESYRRMQQALGELDPETTDLSLFDITVLSTSDPLIVLLNSYVDTGKSIRNIRVTHTGIRGQYIEDALVYRMNVGVAA